MPKNSSIRPSVSTEHQLVTDTDTGPQLVPTLAQRAAGKKHYSNLDVASTKYDIVHLIDGKESCFRIIIFNKCKSFVFICDVIKCQVDAPHWPKRQEGLFYCVFAKVKIYTADIDAASAFTYTLQSIPDYNCLLSQMTNPSNQYCNSETANNTQAETHSRKSTAIHRKKTKCYCLKIPVPSVL